MSVGMVSRAFSERPVLKEPIFKITCFRLITADNSSEGCQDLRREIKHPDSIYENHIEIFSVVEELEVYSR